MTPRAICIFAAYAFVACAFGVDAASYNTTCDELQEDCGFHVDDMSAMLQVRQIKTSLNSSGVQKAMPQVRQIKVSSNSSGVQKEAELLDQEQDLVEYAHSSGVHDHTHKLDRALSGKRRRRRKSPSPPPPPPPPSTPQFNIDVKGSSITQQQANDARDCLNREMQGKSSELDFTRARATCQQELNDQYSYCDGCSFWLMFDPTNTGPGAPDTTRDTTNGRTTYGWDDLDDYKQADQNTVYQGQTWPMDTSVPVVNSKGVCDWSEQSFWFTFPGMNNKITLKDTSTYAPWPASLFYGDRCPYCPKQVVVVKCNTQSVLQYCCSQQDSNGNCANAQSYKWRFDSPATCW